MTISITAAASAQPLNVLGERLRPLTPGRAQHRGVRDHRAASRRGRRRTAIPWDEVYAVLDGTLEVFDGQAWRPGQGRRVRDACPPGQVHAYRNGSPGCRFLTIAGPGHARELFEQLDAEVTAVPPDMGAVLAVAARNGVEVVHGRMSRHQALPQPRPAGPPRADQAGHRRGVHRPARRPRPGGAVPGGGRPGRRCVNPDGCTITSPTPRHSSPPSPPRWKPGCSPARPRCRTRPPSCQPWSQPSTGRPKASCRCSRALVASSVGSQIRRRRRARRLQAIQDTLEQIGAGHDETRRAIAIVSLLASADAGVVLADQYGLTLDQAGQACAEATRAIISHLTTQATPGTTPAPSEPHHH